MEAVNAIAPSAKQAAAAPRGHESASTTNDANATADDGANEQATAPGSVEDDPDVVMEAETVRRV